MAIWLARYMPEKNEGVNQLKFRSKNAEHAEAAE
jgi:hypothetical protein